MDAQARRGRGCSLLLVGLGLVAAGMTLAFRGKTKPSCEHPKNEKAFVDCLDKTFVGRKDMKKSLVAVYKWAEQHSKMMERRQTKNGLKTSRGEAGRKPPTPHFVLTGGPGSGKTTVAREMGAMLKRFGILTAGKVHTVQRGQLCADDAQRTVHTIVREWFEKAKGGILFIDEAERLVNENPNPCGRDVVEEIMSHLNEADDTVVIFACYEKDMRKLYAVNEGLERRIYMEIHLADYEPRDLVEMFERKAREEGYKLRFNQTFLQESMSQKKVKSLIPRYNAGLVEHLLYAVETELSSRTNDTQAVIMEIEKQDITAGFKKKVDELQHRPHGQAKLFGR